MATQHPDNAGVPWWKTDNNPFISTKDEITELMTLYKELPIDEYMWDWEGKFVDEAVGEKLFSQGADILKEKKLGQDIHLTYRIPAYDEKKLHRMSRAFMNVLSMYDLAQDIGLERPPVHEMFLPMTTSAAELLAVRETFLKIAAYHREIFHSGVSKHEDLLEQLLVTPLVEDVDSMFAIEEILEPYWSSLLNDKLDLNTYGQRIFLARSDPALNAGLVPAVLAVKVALSAATELGEKLGFAVHPVIGTGSLPFRGSVNPEYVDTFIEQYAGVRTYSIQSAFRYDYDLETVRKTLELMKKEVPKRDVVRINTEERAELRKIVTVFAELWKPTIEALAPTINTLASYVPGHRERLQHTGLFGYNRGIGGVTLPRAIKFTASLYSIGLPPELIATGRGLRAIKESGQLPLLEKYYPALEADLVHAGKYLNRENLELAAAKDPVFANILDGLKFIESYIGKELGPWKPRHIIHRNITSSIYQRLQHELIDEEQVKRDILEAAHLRHSLG